MSVTPSAPASRTETAPPVRRVNVRRVPGAHQRPDAVGARACPARAVVALSLGAIVAVSRRPRNRPHARGEREEGRRQRRVRARGRR